MVEQTSEASSPQYLAVGVGGCGERLDDDVCGALMVSLSVVVLRAMPAVWTRRVLSSMAKNTKQRVRPCSVNLDGEEVGGGDGVPVDPQGPWSG